MQGITEIDGGTLAVWLERGTPLTLVDVRTPAEMQRGMLDGAWAMPLHTVPIRATELPRETPIVAYCRSGARSGRACAYLNSLGYDEVYNLRGGVERWLAQGGPLVRAPRAAAGG